MKIKFVDSWNALKFFFCFSLKGRRVIYIFINEEKKIDFFELPIFLMRVKKLYEFIFYISHNYDYFSDLFTDLLPENHIIWKFGTLKIKNELKNYC